MGFLKVIFIIAITMALSITLTMKSITQEETKPTFVHHDLPSHEQQPLILPLSHHQKNVLLPPKRVNRFLAQIKNPNAADHCHKDNEICSLIGVKNSTCCNNKCIDVGYDKHNCGACKKKCKFTEICCRGQCVDINFDKRHCGACNHRCERSQYCIYGFCDYA
ncbi:stigma-specific STIG1-like protein 1 [Abrus precatorius]|uniref:Stigma-specific STIG1-like protein 1 n=1 Tax=Abrus precatorius TaxID=3816 RepID=A0A8B8KK93_ABRPR|nr:stigma-specific STIG1-like protein 1 [Abrus precatorius]